MHPFIRQSIATILALWAALKKQARVKAHSDREFLPAAMEIVTTPASPVAIGLIWFFCIGFTVTLIWACIGEIDIFAVAQGKVQPQGRSKVIQPFESGAISKLNVENGQAVTVDDVVAELDATAAFAERDATLGDYTAARAEIMRRSHLIGIVSAQKQGPLTLPPISPEISAIIQQREISVMQADFVQLNSTLESLKAQQKEKAAQIARLKTTIASREQLIKILKERVDIRQYIEDSQQGFRARVIDALQEYLRELTGLATDQGQLAEAEASILSLDRKFDQVRSEFLSEQTQKLNEAERKKDHLFHELIKLDTKASHMTLRAPISGTIQQLAVTTLGQVVASGQALMTVVPNTGAIEVEAMVLNSDIGFVGIGQRAVVKIDAFPFTRFGTIGGTVTKVSREAIDSREASGLADAAAATRPQGTQPQTSGFSPSQTLVFPITVTLDRTDIVIDGQPIPLQAGMAAIVEIVTGKRKVIDFVMSPLKEVISTSGHER